MPALSLNGALTLSDNEYQEYRNEPGDLVGRTVPGLPRFSAAAAARWSTAAGVILGVSATSVGDYFADDANQVAVQGYGLLGGSAAYERSVGGSRVRAFLHGSNLTDAAHVASVFINPLRDSSGEAEAIEPGLPRA